jgi:predicted dinucleotide-binding enzyme
MAHGIGYRLVKGGDSVVVHGEDKALADRLATEIATSGHGRAQSAELDARIGGDAVILALPYETALETARKRSGELAGRILIDVSNPIDPSFDELLTGPDVSGAEEIAAAAGPEVKVVKAFNTNFARTLLSGEVGGMPIDVFVASDHEDAKAKVMGLIGRAGLRPIDAGPLRRSRLLEAMQLLAVTLQVRHGLGFTTAFKLLP